MYNGILIKRTPSPGALMQVRKDGLNEVVDALPVHSWGLSGVEA